MYPTTKPLNFTFLQYLNPPEETCKPNFEDSGFLNYIMSDHRFKDFLKLVQVAGMESDLNSKLKHMTLFLPTDCSNINFTTIDQLEARKIVMLSMLPSKLYRRDLITGLFDTFLRNRQLWIDQGVINRKSRIIKYDIPRLNGVIHIIDRLPF